MLKIIGAGNIKNDETENQMEDVKNLKYIRDRLTTYFEISAGECPEYVKKMLEHNKPQNFLEMKMCVRANENVWRIFVTGEKSLDVVFRALPINYAGLSVILHGLTDAFSEADELLLPLDGILLDPKYIFVDIKDYKTRFIYIPGLTLDTKSQTENFFEYLLNRVDYDDMRAVNLLYDCYTLSMKEGRGIEAIEARLREEAEAESSEDSGDFRETENAEGLTETEKQKESVFRPERGKDINRNDKEKDLMRFPGPAADRDLFGRDEHFPTDYADEYYSNGYEVKPDFETKIKEWFMGFFGLGKKKTEKREIQKEEIKKPTADESLYDMSGFVQDSEETVLLYGGVSGKIPYLKDKKGTVTSLTKSPFLIGSLMYHTDFTVKDASVSRLHAEISYDEKGTVITDLNSTNGTYLNGELLVPKEKYSLNEGDTLVIGQVSYVFGAGT